MADALHAPFNDIAGYRIEAALYPMHGPVSSSRAIAGRYGIPENLKKKRNGITATAFHLQMNNSNPSNTGDVKMTRVKIEDLPVNEEMSEQELKGVFGGVLVALRPPRRWSQKVVPPNGALVGSVPPNGAVPPRLQVRGNSRGAISTRGDKEIVNTSLIR